MRSFAYFLAILSSAGCGGVIRHAAAGTTAEILAMAQPALQQESDYELASRAIPGALKTIEGFYVADAQEPLRAILAEGYCQYANAFVEDEWEIAKLDHHRDLEAYHSVRASKMYTRCLNYALVKMGSAFEAQLYGKSADAIVAVKAVGKNRRDDLMWVGAGLGGVMQHNLATNSGIVAYKDVVQAILEHVVELDKAKYGDIDGAKQVPCDAQCTVHLALPHVALGMIYTAVGPQFGGKPDLAEAEFKTALRITADAKHPDGRMLLARVLLARQVGVITNNRKMFHEELVKVLQTDPAIWPEQRLANEVAHRKARRYLAHEKDFF
jgi:hypothetical protein